uniref:(northern house mosquito) hypothetical protein n=1 Tax=Culex pipiens TaxID=7175 RepID=A0A8D8JMU4_CULPI
MCRQPANVLHNSRLSRFNSWQNSNSPAFSSGEGWYKYLNSTTSMLRKLSTLFASSSSSSSSYHSKSYDSSHWVISRFRQWVKAHFSCSVGGSTKVLLILIRIWRWNRAPCRMLYHRRQTWLANFQSSGSRKPRMWDRTSVGRQLMSSMVGRHSLYTFFHSTQVLVCLSHPPKG